LRVLAEDVECPSLSPDETKVAYKKRAGGPGKWRLHVRDLRTGTEWALAEQRSVDDQVEWLDDGQVLYGLPRDGRAQTDVWVVPADGSGQPHVLVPNAWSPAVVR
jgi:Tol biopolymer transport system component